MNYVHLHKKDLQNRYYCELTDELNKHLSPQWRDALSKGWCDGTYILDTIDLGSSCYAIRFPGATRGHIEVDEQGIIIDIQFYDTCFINGVGCYESSATAIRSKYIGYKILVTNDVYENF